MLVMIFAVLCLIAGGPVSIVFSSIGMPTFGGIIGSLLLFIGVCTFFLYPVVRLFSWLNKQEIHSE